MFAVAPMLAAAVDFNRDVLPVFEKYCLGCHASGIRMGSFECDTYEGVMRGANHGSVVEPGNAKESRLYRSLTGDLSPPMPMSQEKLTKAEIETIRKWIEEGAKAPDKRSAKPPDKRATLIAWQFRTSNVTGSPARPAKSPR